MEYFGTLDVSMKFLSEWKMSWIEDTPHQIHLMDLTATQVFDGDGTVKASVVRCADFCGIHPYFYEYWVQKDNVVTSDIAEGDNINAGYIVKVYPTVSFLKEEHLIMFKLAWQ